MSSPTHLQRLTQVKQAGLNDVRLDKVEAWIPTGQNMESSVAELPTSRVVRRAILTKEAKGGLAVRKLVVWETRKHEIDPAFPAWVVHWTDYSPGRASPLERDVRPAPDEATACAIADAFVAENTKKGWSEVGA